MKKTSRWFRRADWILWTFIAILPLIVWVLRITCFPYHVFQPTVYTEHRIDYPYDILTNQYFAKEDPDGNVTIYYLNQTHDETTYYLPTDPIYGEIQEGIAFHTSLYKVLIDDFRMSGLTEDTSTTSANPIYKVLFKLDRDYLHVFGRFGDMGFLLYLSYFIMVSIFHLVADVVLFIPRFFLDFMDGD